MKCCNRFDICGNFLEHIDEGGIFPLCCYNPNSKHMYIIPAHQIVCFQDPCVLLLHATILICKMASFSHIGKIFLEAKFEKNPLFFSSIFIASLFLCCLSIRQVRSTMTEVRCLLLTPLSITVSKNALTPCN